jgi:NTP pyrophosphatase (non-canonical NTP hydrolase)
MNKRYWSEQATQHELVTKLAEETGEVASAFSDRTRLAPGTLKKHRRLTANMVAELKQVQFIAQCLIDYLEKELDDLR